MSKRAAALAAGVTAVLGAARAFAQVPPAPPEPALEQTFTLEDAEQKARLNNAALQSAEQDVVIAEQRVQESRFLFFPEVGVQASATRYNARYPFTLSSEARNVLAFPSDLDNIYSGRAYLFQSLYEGRRHLNLLRLSSAALKQAKTRFETVRLESAFTAKRVFYRLLLAQESLAAVETRLRACEDILGRGFSGWDRVEAESIVAGLRAKLAAAQRGVENARLEFRKGLNLELDTPVRASGSLKTEPLSIDIDKAIVWATELRPELQAETYKAQMDAIAVNLAVGRRNPTLFLAGDYEVTGQRFPLRQNNWDLTVGIKLPFSYDFWTQLRVKRAEQRQGQIKRAEIHDQVRLEVRQAHAELSFWHDEWPRREKEYARIKTLLEAAQSSGGGLPALRAHAAFLEVQSGWLESVEEHILSRARLERAVGRTLTP